MTNLCDLCKKEKNEVYYKNLIFSNGKTAEVFLCADCYNKSIEEILLMSKPNYCKAENKITIHDLYNEIKSISEKLSQIINILNKK